MVFQENLLGLTLAIAAWAAVRAGPGPRPHHLLIAAVALVASSLIKPLAAVFVVAGAAGAGIWLWRTHLLSRRGQAVAARRMRQALVAGLAAILLGYLLAWGAADLLRWLPLSGRSPVASPLGLLRAVGYLQLAASQPFLLTLALWGALAGAGRTLTARAAGGVPEAPPERSGLLLAVAAGLLLYGLPAVSAFVGNADRIRYAMPLLPAIHLLGAHVLWRELRPALSTPSPEPTSAPRSAGWATGAALVALHLAAHVFFRFVAPAEVRDGLVEVSAGRFTALAPLALVAAMSLYVAWRSYGLWRHGRHAALALALAAAGLAVSGTRWGAWLHNPPRELQAARADLLRRLPKRAIVAGQWAPSLVLDGPLRALHLHYTFNLPKRHLCKLRPTHLITYANRPEENSILARDYPGWTPPAGHLATYSVAGHRLDLYAVPRSAVEATCPLSPQP